MNKEALDLSARLAQQYNWRAPPMTIWYPCEAASDACVRGKLVFGPGLERAKFSYISGRLGVMAFHAGNTARWILRGDFKHAAYSSCEYMLELREATDAADSLLGEAP